MEITKFTSEPENTTFTKNRLRLTQDREYRKQTAALWKNETKPQVGDGDEGGGVVLGNVPWGERVLCTAHQVLRQVNQPDRDVKLHALRITAEGNVFIRLDNPSNKFGFPGDDDIDNFTDLFIIQFKAMKKSGEIRTNLSVEVTFPGLNRPLRVPEELLRFKDESMRVWYLEGKDLKRRIFKLVSIEIESEEYVWRLVNAIENEDLFYRGKHWTPEQVSQRFRVSFGSLKRVALYF